MNTVANRRQTSTSPRRTRRRIKVPKTSPMTTIPILTKIWSWVHGSDSIKRGALQGKTYTDYFVFSCPCGAILHNGIGVRLLGVSDHLDERLVFVFGEHEPESWRSRNAFETPVLSFELYCPHCGLLDHFKMPVDQAGELTAAVQSEIRSAA
jgi:hypothetical protein